MSHDLPGQPDKKARSEGWDVVVPERGGRMSRVGLLSEVKEAFALVTLLSDRVDTELLDAAPRLKIVANYAVGYDNIDLSACKERGIVVTNTPDVLTEATADLTWALLLGSARRLVEGHRLVSRGEYQGWAPHLLLGQDVGGRVLGIFGAGRIGRAVAERSVGFGMKVLYTDSYPWEEGEKRLGAKRVAWEELLEQSDFLSLHAPLLPDTEKVMNRDAFSRMKPTAILINAARGGLVDEDALLEALDKGELFGAGLDVYDPEPPLQSNPLLKHPRIVLAPHLGSASVGVREEMGRLVIENILAVWEGRPPLTPVG